MFMYSIWFEHRVTGGGWRLKLPTSWVVYAWAVNMRLHLEQQTLTTVCYSIRTCWLSYLSVTVVHDTDVRTKYLRTLATILLMWSSWSQSVEEVYWKSHFWKSNAFICSYHCSTNKQFFALPGLCFYCFLIVI